MVITDRCPHLSLTSILIPADNKRVSPHHESSTVTVPMAEVLPPIVQSTSTMTMLHTPPDAFQNANPSQQPHSSSRMAQIPRSHIFNANNGGMSYRGMASTPAYAFRSTPNLRQEVRSSSSPMFRPQPGQSTMHNTYSSSSSTATASSSSSNPSQKGHYILSKDDSVLAMPRQPAALTSTLMASSSTPDLLMRSYDAPARPSPDRYRRVQRRADSSPAIPTLQNIENQTAMRHSLVIPPEQLSKQNAFFGGESPIHRRAGSADDSVIGRPDGVSRYRRRSVGAFEPSTFAGTFATAPAPQPTTRSWAQVVAGPATAQPTRPLNNLPRPNSFHQQQQNSIENSKRPSSARQNSYNSQKPAQPNRPTTSPALLPSRQEQRAPSSSSRGSVDSTKRLTAPSPLSKPVTAELDTPKEAPTVNAPASPKPSTPDGSSPAVQQLHAITESQPAHKVKSRLRRAFSFGSSQELKKASGEATTAAERAKLRKEKHDNDVDAEEAAIIAKQEAAGLGASIYSNQALSGSTDNVSFSSTASSASLMLRKMGQGFKKSTRSLKHLFRPKSVVGVPAADGPAAAQTESTAEVSLVTVEAETHRVNVNADPHEQPGGGTGYPKLERNSMEAASRTATPERPASSQENRESWSRRSIIGGERERAEVLAAVRKGILKRMHRCNRINYVYSLSTGSGTSSGNSSPVIAQSDSPAQVDISNPGTPNDRSAAEGMSDYFIAASRLTASSTKSLPGTGANSAPPTMRNISFSNRIQCYDVWSSQEYDRRGDIATCNRLTPMLAQQIKEELNSFKMVCYLLAINHSGKGF